MTPHTDHKPHIRDLIRSFARVDEHFDGDELFLSQPQHDDFHLLNWRLEYILSLPLNERSISKEEGQRILTEEELKSIRGSIDHARTDSQQSLRETLRDKLYDCLLRMDHCDEEQLSTRGVHFPGGKKLSLFQVLQLVVFMISDTLANLETSAQLSE